MQELLRDERLQQVLSREARAEDWQGDLARLIAGDASLTRRSAGEEGIRAVQRLLVFLGYSTSSSGAFTIDGDFGRGTNRGVAQFQFERELNDVILRKHLCYPCTWQTARSSITAIPEARLDRATLEAMARAVLTAADSGELPLGRFDEALFHLNALDERRMLRCAEILERFGSDAEKACAIVADESGVSMRREWVLAIIKQETAGVVRPRFEQHWLSKLSRRHPRADLADLRLRSMSIGLGQIMGANHDRVGAASARAMLTSPIEDQVLFVARFLSARKDHLAREDPGEEDFRAIARFYNGPGYEKHHYHESLERWFREFRLLS